MPFTDEQAKQIKEQILKQVETFPEDKRDQIRQYVSSMNNEQLEEFVIKNKLIKGEGTGEDSKQNPCIMCAISSKQVSSTPIYEDENYLVVLELNPLSKGHAILIPKKHLKEAKELDKNSKTLANKIGKHITKKLKADEFQLAPSAELGHAIINIIPAYKGEQLQRKKASPEELKDLVKVIGEIKKGKAGKKSMEKAPEVIEKRVTPQIIKLPRRIP